MTSKYTLHYFNTKGRAEVLRWMFAIANVEYTDQRYSQEDWAEFKPKTPFGQLPVLEIDDVMLAQSEAIAVYLARKFDLMGSSALEEAEILMIGGCMNDAIQPLITMLVTGDEMEKAQCGEKFATSELPKLLEFLKSKLGDKQYLVGDKLTLADLSIARLLSDLPPPVSPLVQKYPSVDNLVKRVVNLPELAAWIEKRPNTPY